MIRVLIRDLPPKVRGCTVRAEEGEYTILLNARMSFEMQRETYLHEMRHIARDDFAGGDVNEIEARNGKAKTTTFGQMECPSNAQR